MTNYMEMGADVLQQRMEAYAGINTIYRRVDGSRTKFSFSIVAVPGRNPVDLVDTNGVVLRGQIQDFIVSIPKMIQGMSGIEPNRPIRGDEFVATIGVQRIVFIVNGEDFATSHYEPADSYGKAWRIHTKSDRLVDA